MTRSRYVVAIIPATGETWSVHAVRDYSVSALDSAVYAAADVLVAGDGDCWELHALGEYADAGAASVAWATLREEYPTPLAAGAYAYDGDGVAPVAIALRMVDRSAVR